MITDLSIWRELCRHYNDIKSTTIADLMSSNAANKIQCMQIDFDYSRNLCSAETLKLLAGLAQQAGLLVKIQALFSGAIVNDTEGKSALHTALRAIPSATPLIVNDIDINQEIGTALTHMEQFVAAVHRGDILSISNKKFTHVVTIGVGGSYLGPQMVAHALTEYKVPAGLTCHFIADIDELAITAVLNTIDPQHTLFVIASKSFTTLETQYNVNLILHWMVAKLRLILPDAHLTPEQILNTQFVAVTAQRDKARALGIPVDRIFLMWDWVGGRYSIWSVIGLPVVLHIGMHNFKKFLHGAYIADQHFLTAAMPVNIPIIMALLGVWYINFFNANTHAIIPYDYRLKYLLSYLQQLDMESNGKSVTLHGSKVNYATGPILWGGLGIHGQHAFNQLLHQGTHFVPIDFFVVKNRNPKARHNIAYPGAQELLLKNALAQADAACYGSPDALPLYEQVAGNRPSNMFVLEQLTPQTLGTMLAFYEHKVFVQSVIWNINPFDQWGVVLGKKLLFSSLSKSERRDLC